VKNETLTMLQAGSRTRGVADIEISSIPAPITVAVVDDDQSFRDALTFQLVTAGFHVAGYPSAESFLAPFRLMNCDCIVADICLPGLNGLQLLAEVKQSVPFVSIIFVTGRGDISIGVQAMREGAVDCLQKPIDEQSLLDSIRRGAALFREKRAEDQRRLELQVREETLTPREHEVFGLIATGLLNKQVGATLGATERTIKTHRGRVMDKMCADSLADLVRMAEILRVQPIFPSQR
jgi:two-component system response regulator FixJ